VSLPGRGRRLIGLLLLIGALGYLFVHRLGWDELVTTLGAFDPSFGAAIVLAQLAFHFLGAGALWVLTLGAAPIRFSSLTRAYWRGLAVGYWTPAGVGEASFAWFMRRGGVPVHEGLALLTVDKLVTLAVTTLAASPALLLAASRTGVEWRSPSPATILVLAAGLLLGAVLLWVSKESSWMSRLRWAMVLYLRAVRDVAARSSVHLAANVLVTIARTIAASAVFWWAVSSFGGPPQISFLNFFVRVSAARLLALVLPAPNGLGIFEVTLVELLGDGAVPAAAVFSGAILARLVALVLVSVGFFVRPADGGSDRVEPGEVR
jgi:uncharacterized membrane protein YbhN (UPF0104 family)